MKASPRKIEMASSRTAYASKASFYKGRILAFSSVKADYFARIENLSDRPVDLVYALSETQYRQWSAGNRIDRIRLRLAMYFIYPIKVIWHSHQAHHRDTLLVSSNTFFAPLLAWAGSRNQQPRIVHWLFDLFPDALEVSGAIPAGGIVAKILGIIQRLMNRLCDHVVYLGEILRQHGQRRWGAARSSMAIDLTADENMFSYLGTHSDGQIVAHYGGQLGRMHDAEGLAAAIAQLTVRNQSNLRFDFRISGSKRAWFSQRMREVGLTVDGPINSADWRKLIATFHIGLVSLSPGGATVCIPSKTYAMMAGGLAIVAICPAWSDLARLITDHRCGIVINNSPYEAASELGDGDYLRNAYARCDEADIVRRFVEAVNSLTADRLQLESYRRASLVASRTLLGTQVTRASWAACLDDKYWMPQQCI